MNILDGFTIETMNAISNSPTAYLTLFMILLYYVLKSSNQREKEILIMRYGLSGHDELTQKEVAQKMGISQSYISRLEKRIMLRLRKEILRKTTCA